MVHPLASLPIASRHRVSQIAFHPSHPFLAIQSHDRFVEIFRIRTEEEVRKKQARRLKRAKEKKGIKKGKTDSHNDEEREDDLIQGLEKEVQLIDLFTPHTIVRAAGKVRSFDFVKEDSETNHVQVRVLQAERRQDTEVIRRYSHLHLPIQRKCSLFRFPPKARIYQSLLEPTLWICRVTEQIFGLSLSVRMINYWRQHRTVSSIHRYWIGPNVYSTQAGLKYGT